MVDQKGATRVQRLTYKTYLSLFPGTWDKLAAEAHKRKISGRELIQALLTQWGTAQPPAPKMDVPSKDAPPQDDAAWADLAGQGPE